MNWKFDQNTALFVKEHIPQTFINWKVSGKQYPGRNFNPQSWRNKVMNLNYLQRYHLSSPQNILTAIQQNHLLEALALTVSWGTMWRQNPNIYNQDLNVIEEILQKCIELITKTESIEESWNLLANQLEWTSVMCSKMLHFISRALGHVQDPPVALDNLVILQQVWPTLIQNANKETIPRSWNNCLPGYLRYMTFINTLRDQYYPKWTNTDIEATLFEKFYPHK